MSDATKKPEDKSEIPARFMIGLTPTMVHTDAVTSEAFSKAIGKTNKAVVEMIKKGKLPGVEMKIPGNPSAKGDYYIYLPAWNAGIKLAFESRPKEIRDGWLAWLGLSI
ncbi:Cox family DNA-binding protein [Aeromonas salmonicida]|uniref:Cox family DNA-binding protein n=1 Tax=Aeromonas salmonicida TaxID=645 RepID=UPI001F5B89D1|nr:Cox family DNA-binding protein [Aeromonas salmonicida]WCH32902.1 regulatory phage cox family protein [Aeromonas salmonicida]WCH37112.1 regulatory phage cox family protein [Aeromonas salmonicida]WGI37814.1 Cox family DNA-binding protein [Aeromonas salmonicida]